MRETINLIQFNQKIPLSFSVIKFDNVFLHMHSTVQLVIVLDGEFECTIEEKKYIAKENDIFIINPRTYHHFEALNKTSTILSVIIDQNEFGLDSLESDNIYFKLNSMEQAHHPRYDNIKYLIFSIVKFNTMENINSIYTNRAIAYSLFAQLMNDFQVNIEESELKRSNYDTITKITAYINDHFAENLSLSYISEHFNYSIAYLSRLFKKSLDTNFKDYYDNIRINYSLNDLLLTNKSIEEIALNNGFENSRSYLRAFTSIYKTYPSQYRKKYKDHVKLSIEDSSELKKETIEKILNLYEQIGTKTNNPNRESTRDTESLVSVDYKGKLTPLSNPQTKVLQFEDCNLLMDIDIQKRLENIQKDINFEYITICNLFSKEFNFYREINGKYILSFVTFDRLISYLKSVNIKPYIKLAYDEELINESNFIEILYEFAYHLSSSYSKEEVDSWMINLSFKNLNNYNKESLQNLQYIYHQFFTIIRRQFKNIKIGCPCLTKQQILNSKLLESFVSYCKSKYISPSFLPIIYQDPLTDTKLSKNKDDLKDFINKLKEKGYFFENKMYFENINFTSNNSLLNDTIYSSSFLTKNLIDNIKSVSSYSKLECHDLSNELYFNKIPFNGSNSFFTSNNLKKPAYHAYSLFSKLGNNLLKKSSNYIITTKENKIIILVNNYSHYSNLYAENEYYQISEQQRYHCFPKSTNIKFTFNITNVGYKECKIKTTMLTKSSGSSFDKWLEVGAPENMDNNELEILRHTSEMHYHIENKNIIDSKLNIECIVAPLETKLIEITLIK